MVVNVCRDRQMENLLYTNWSRTKANSHDPVRFAHLLLWPEEGFSPSCGRSWIPRSQPLS
jgi:hypothetical protein